MKKHIQFLAFLLLVMVASIYTACQKETIKSQNAQTVVEVPEGRFTSDFKVTDSESGATFILHVGSDDETLVALFNPQTVTARLNSPGEPVGEIEDNCDDEAASAALLLDDLTRVVIYVSRIEAPGIDESTTYGVSFAQSLERALKTARAKMVVLLDKTEIGDLFREKLYVSCKKIRVKGSSTATTRINWGPENCCIHDLHVNFPINTSTWTSCTVCQHGYPTNKIKELQANYIADFDVHICCNPPCY